MRFTPLPSSPDRRLAGIVITVVLHLLLLWGWRASMKVTAQPDVRRTAIEWVDVKLPRPVTRPAPPREAVVPVRRKASAGAANASRPAVAVTVAPVAEVLVAPAAPEPPTRSAADMLDQAKRDIGKFDKELRKEFAILLRIDPLDLRVQLVQPDR
jgi:hypothetical protein